MRTTGANRLRAAFEGEGLTVLRHMKLAARLKNEWPDLFDAIEEAVYTQPTIDVRAMADSVLAIAEDLAYPVQEVEPFIYSDGSPVTKGWIAWYLDNAIREWREIGANADHRHFDIAPYYVDAFQSVRLSLLGETLPLDTESDTQ